MHVAGLINMLIPQTFVNKVIDRELDKWQGQVGNFKMPGLWANRTYMGIESLLLYNVCVVSAVLKVGAVERHRLSCLYVFGGSISRTSGGSQCLVQIIRCSCMIRNLETVKQVDAYAVEARWSMSEFIQSLVN